MSDIYIGTGISGHHGRFELGIDRRLGEPGELFVVAGPDPEILVSDGALHQIMYQQPWVHPAVTLMWPDSPPCSIAPTPQCCRNQGFLALRGNNCFHGALLTVDTTTGRIIYRIGTYDLEHRAWHATWPD